MNKIILDSGKPEEEPRAGWHVMVMGVGSGGGWFGLDGEEWPYRGGDFLFEESLFWEMF